VLSPENIFLDLEPYDFERITVGVAAGGLTAAKMATASGRPAKAARMVCDTTAISYREEGGTPVAGQAIQRAVGAEWMVWGQNAVRNFKAIRNGGADGYIAVTYYV